MSIIPTHTYSNPLFSGSNQASNSPDVNLQYIWDAGINSDGGWRPLNTGDLLTVNIEDAQINVNLDKEEDSVNIYTSESQSINIESTELDIRSLNSTTDSVKAYQNDHDEFNTNSNIQIDNSDASSTNPVPNYSPDSYLSITPTDKTFTNPESSPSVDLHPANKPPYTKHGYIFHCHTGSNGTFSADFIFEASLDNSNWSAIETRTVNSSVDTSFSYYDEFNFKHCRVTFTGAAIEGNCLMQQKHDL